MTDDHSSVEAVANEPWWMGGWSYNLDVMPNHLVEVAFDAGLGFCSIHICQRYISSPTLVNGYPVPKADWTYGYTASDGSELNTHGRRAYAWRPVPIPPPPSQGKWPTEAKAGLDAERFIASYAARHVREYIARKIASSPTPSDQDKLVGELVEAGRFLLDRLVDHEVRTTSDEDSREWHGHVTPAMASFRAAITRSRQSGSAEQ